MLGESASKCMVDGLGGVVGDDSLQTGSNDLGSAGVTMVVDETIDGRKEVVGELDGNLSGHTQSITKCMTGSDFRSRNPDIHWPPAALTFYSDQTRERRWFNTCQRICTGPWRWLAARPTGWTAWRIPANPR